MPSLCHNFDMGIVFYGKSLRQILLDYTVSVHADKDAVTHRPSDCVRISAISKEYSSFLPAADVEGS